MAISKVTTSNTNTINKVTVTDGDAISIITVGTQGLAGAATLLGRTTEAETVGSGDAGSTIIYDHSNARWLATTSSNATSLNTKLAGLVFTAGGATVTGVLDEDNLGSDSNTKLATQQSIKAYVDAQITAQDFDFQGDSGGALSIDLDSETMTFTGGTGIDTSGSGNTVTFAIDSTVATLSGSQTLSNKTLTAPVLNTVDINGGDISSSTTINKSPSITLAGDLSGSVTLSNLANGTLTATIASGSVTNAMLAGSIGNSKLANSSITVTDGSNSTATALGGTITFAAGEGLDVAESSGTVTFSAEDATASNKGVASFDSTDFLVSSGAVTLVVERISDIVGSMVTSNTESGITVTYQDGDNTLDFDVGDFDIALTGDVTGSGTVTNLGNVSITTTVAANSVALGTDTTGNYLLDIAVGEGLDVSHSQGEGSTATISAELATETNAGVATFDGTDFTVSSGDVTLNAERIQDIVGAMVGSNTESGIAVTYEDGDGTLDFNVNDPTITIDGDVDGSATMTNLGNTTITTTLDTVNSNVGSFGSATAIPAITVNAKGLVTAVTTNNIATSFTLAADSGSNDTFNTGETLTFTGTSNEITTTVSNNAITFALPDDVTIGNDLTVTGDLTVNGDTVTLNTATLDVEDATIRVAKGATSLANTNGAGIEFGASSSKPTLTWDNSNSRLTSNKTFHAASLVGALTGNASTATALETARTIHGVSFDGTANIDLSEVISDTVGAMFSSNTETGITATYQDSDNTIDLVVGTLNQDTTGNAATATALETARTIGGTSFDGTANIAIALAATATALANARTIHGVSFDGTANIDLTEVIQDTVGGMFSSNTETGITVTYEDSDGTIDLVVGTLNQDTTGNAATATALETARTIHGVSFDGTGNIDLSEVISDTVGAMFSSNTETGVTVTYQDSDNTIDVVVDTSALTETLTNKTLTSPVINTGVSGTAIKDEDDMASDSATHLATQQSIKAYVDATAQTTEEVQDIVGAMFSSNTETGITVTYEDGDGTIDLVVGTLNQDTTGTAALATTVTVSANNSTDENIFPVFVDGATGTQGLETDTGLTYNPSTGLLTATGFSGNLTGTLQTAAQTNITSVGTLSALTVSGDVAIDTNVLKVDTSNNRVGIKQASPTVSLDIGQATDAILLPVGTTAQRPSGAAGQFRYNSTLSRFEGYTDAWGEIGGGGTSTLSVNTFTANGSTTAFTLSQAPASEDNILVFVEGVFMNANDFVLNGTTLTLDAAPPNGRKITVYHVTAAVAGTGLTQDSFTGNGSTTAYTLSAAPVSENNTQVYIDGVYQNKATYSTSGTTLTFDAAPANSAAIEAITFTQTNINNFPASGISDLTQVTPVAGDFMMILDATDSALKKSDVKDVMRTAVAIDSSADAVALTFDADEDATFAGNINLADGKKAIFGAGSDLQIYHSGSHSHIHDNGSGNLYLDTNGAMIELTYNANNENMAQFAANGAVTLYHDNAAKFATTASGIQVTGNIANTSGDFTLDVAGNISLDADGGYLFLKDGGTTFGQLRNESTDFSIKSITQDKDLIFKGNDGGTEITALTLDMSEAGKATFNNAIVASGISQFADVNIPDNNAIRFGSGQDLQIYHDGTNSSIQNTTGELFIYGGTDEIRLRAKNDEESIVATPNGAVTLYHDGSSKLATASDGVDITGGADLTDTLKITRTGTDDAGIILATANANRYIASDENGVVSIGTGTTLTGGTQYLTIDSGKVGIGETSPDAPLHITSNTPIIVFDESDASQEWRLGSFGGAFALYDSTDSAYRIAVDGSGNVGIGTTSPSTKLHLGGTAPLDSIIRQDSTSSGTNWEIGERSAGKWQIFEDDNDSIVATFMSTGNVGIGTASPDKKLEVAGTDVVAKFTGTDANPPQIEFENSTGVQATIGLKSGHDFIIDTAGEDVHIGTNASSAGANGLMIAATGKVGIGAPSPADTLSVAANGSMGIGIYKSPDGVLRSAQQVMAIGTGSSGSNSGSSGGNEHGIIQMFHDGDEDIRLYTQGASWFNGGNLGVGDTSPAYRLELPNVGDSTGQGRANAWITYSDSRIKSNIKVLDYGLDIVKQLKPSQYKQHNSTKDDDGQFVKLNEGNNDIGFIAQEVLPLMPEVVGIPEDTDKDLYSINYPKLTAVLTKAIQEQQTIIDDLKARIEKLES